MRILNTPTPALDLERVAVLERMVQSIREKMRNLEERFQTFERVPKTVEPAVKPATAPVLELRPVRPPLPEATLDAEAFKKNLLAKMWKYLNDDERPAKAA
jgi:hypothetical protein